MLLTAILMRWYRSFNVTALGPADPLPTERWNIFRDQPFPFVSVPLDRLITTVVGANESGKSHLLSAIMKLINGESVFGGVRDRYEIKDICRYCGFSALDEIWPEIGIEFTATATEAALFEAATVAKSPRPDSDVGGQSVVITVILNGSNIDKYATAYRGEAVVRTFSQEEWHEFATARLPHVAILDSELALPNEVHIDELLDLYKKSTPKRVVDALTIQDLWREIEPIDVIQGGAVDASTAQRLTQMKSAIGRSVHGIGRNEQELVHLLFSGVLGVEGAHLERMRRYTNSERGYVSWLNDEINARIERELDISQYWDQDEDFRLSVNYKGGTFHFQITDRTGSTYTFNERSSGLRYFLSYYIQAKALENTNPALGVVILMDEPDSFLSASGQRSLLRVFESLVSKKTAHGACQLVYTTHSPFLINRNFPDRIRLVRKGDGSEGTQYVRRAAVRRFEPVRSALSIDSADTLFLGSTNVVLEGQTDQRLITACIQRFGAPGKLDEMLDLNAVTLVAAGGAPYAAELVRKALRGDEKPPVVVVLLDGDAPGMHFAVEVAKLVDPKQVCTLREVEAGQSVFQVLEDIVPAALLSRAIEAYLRRLGFPYATIFDGSHSGEHQADRIVSFCKANVDGLKSYENAEIRSGVVDALVDLLADETFHMAELKQLERHVQVLCARVNEMIDHAQRNANRHSLKKLVRLQIDTFAKRFPLGAAKADVKKLLNDLKHSAFGQSEDFERTQNNIRLLLERLDAEVQENSDLVEIGNWQTRFQRFKNDPWAKIHDWGGVVAVPAVDATRSAVVDGSGSIGPTTH